MASHQCRMRISGQIVACPQGGDYWLVAKRFLGARIAANLRRDRFGSGNGGGVMARIGSDTDIAAALAGRPVVVTGAGGFIGRRLTERLCALGAGVTVLLRSGHEAVALSRLGARVVRCDLGAGDPPEAALAGAAVLFHFAHDMRAGAGENLRAFEALLAAAARAGVGRIVHASSVVVYDDWPEGAIDEGAPIGQGPGRAGDGDYRRAKIAMEARLMAGPVPAAILQPTIVYGPGSALWTDAPLAALRGGGVVLPEPSGICPAVHVDDVVQAALRAACLPGLGRERFIVSGGDRITWRDFYLGHAGILGPDPGSDPGRNLVRAAPLAALQARLGPVPAGPPRGGPGAAARASAVLRRLLGRRRFEAWVARARALRGGRGPVWPGRAMLMLYAANPTVSTARARDRLGYEPAVTFAEGLAGIQAQLR